MKFISILCLSILCMSAQAFASVEVKVSEAGLHKLVVAMNTVNKGSHSGRVTSRTAIRCVYSQADTGCEVRSIRSTRVLSVTLSKLDTLKMVRAINSVVPAFSGRVTGEASIVCSVAREERSCDLEAL